MAYRDFTELSALIAENSRPQVAQHIRELVNLTERETQAANTTATRYARLYATVETLVTDVSSSTPTIRDDTTPARQSVPNSVIADTVESILSIRDSAQSVSRLINALTDSVPVSFNSQPAVSHIGNGLIPVFASASQTSLNASGYYQITTSGATSINIQLREVSTQPSWPGRLNNGQVLPGVLMKNTGDEAKTLMFYDVVLGSLGGLPLHCSIFSPRVGTPSWTLWVHKDMTMRFKHGFGASSVVDLSRWQDEWDTYAASIITANSILLAANISTPTASWEASSWGYSYVEESSIRVMPFDVAALTSYRASYSTSQLASFSGLGDALLATLRSSNADGILTELQELLQE